MIGETGFVVVWVATPLLAITAALLTLSIVQLDARRSREYRAWRKSVMPVALPKSLGGQITLRAMFLLVLGCAVVLAALRSATAEADVIAAFGCVATCALVAADARSHRFRLGILRGKVLAGLFGGAVGSACFTAVALVGNRPLVEYAHGLGISDTLAFVLLSLLAGLLMGFAVGLICSWWQYGHTPTAWQPGENPADESPVEITCQSTATHRAWLATTPCWMLSGCFHLALFATLTAPALGWLGQVEEGRYTPGDEPPTEYIIYEYEVAPAPVVETLPTRMTVDADDANDSVAPRDVVMAPFTPTDDYVLRQRMWALETQPVAPSVSTPTASAFPADVPPPPLPADLRKQASVSGKYSTLLRVIRVPQDEPNYRQFCDWGLWSGSSWAGHTNLPEGYWVYVFPDWYIWKDSRDERADLITTEYRR